MMITINPHAESLRGMIMMDPLSRTLQELYYAEEKELGSDSVDTLDNDWWKNLDTPDDNWCDMNCYIPLS